MMMMEQTSLAAPIDPIPDHRSDVSDANSVDSYVLISLNKKTRRDSLIFIEHLVLIMVL